MELGIWHSKADKIVNNFHGQNRFQFHGQTPIFMIKTLIFVVKTDFLMFRPTNFIVRSRNILIAKFLGQSPFHFNAKISYSTLFHSNFVLNSVPFQQYGGPLGPSALCDFCRFPNCCLRCADSQIADSTVGLGTRLRIANCANHTKRMRNATVI